jgi:hypothetical protein
MVDVVANIRVAEDWILSFAVAISFLLMVRAGIKLRGIPVGTTPWIAAAGLTPLLLWKMMGAYRRVFVDKAASPELYALLHDWGEAFEAFSGLALAVVLLAIYRRNTAMLD